MENNSSKIHRGSILHAVASRHERSIVKIANDAGYDQSTFYVHIKKDDLPLDILFKYGKSMNHDFSNEIPEMEEYLLVNGLRKSNDKSLSYDELLRERDNWRDKYYALLEENSKLIKEKYSQK